jgi:hypothetical protein
MIKITNLNTTSLRPLMDQMRPREVKKAPRVLEVIGKDKTGQTTASPALRSAGYRQGRDENMPRVVAKGHYLRTRSTKGRR